MAEIDFDLLVERAVTLLRADPRLDEPEFTVKVHVTDELEEPTADQCPAVVVCLADLEQEPLNIMALHAPGFPDWAKMVVEFHCWAFSGQGSRDARKQLHRLLRRVIDVLRDNARFENLVAGSYVRAIRFTYAQDEDTGGIYAGARVELVALALT